MRGRRAFIVADRERCRRCAVDERDAGRCVRLARALGEQRAESVGLSDARCDFDAQCDGAQTSAASRIERGERALRLDRVVAGRVLLHEGRERVGTSREAARAQVLRVAASARREFIIGEAGEEAVVRSGRRLRTGGVEQSRLDPAREIRRRLTLRVLFLEARERFGRGLALQLQDGDALVRLGSVRRARMVGKEAAIDGRRCPARAPAPSSDRRSSRGRVRRRSRSRNEGELGRMPAVLSTGGGRALWWIGLPSQALEDAERRVAGRAPARTIGARRGALGPSSRSRVPGRASTRGSHWRCADSGRRVTVQRIAFAVVRPASECVGVGRACEYCEYLALVEARVRRRQPEASSRADGMRLHGEAPRRHRRIPNPAGSTGSLAPRCRRTRAGPGSRIPCRRRQPGRRDLRGAGDRQDPAGRASVDLGRQRRFLHQLVRLPADGRDREAHQRRRPSRNPSPVARSVGASRTEASQRGRDRRCDVRHSCSAQQMNVPGSSTTRCRRRPRPRERATSLDTASTRSLRTASRRRSRRGPGGCVRQHEVDPRARQRRRVRQCLVLAA